MTFTEKSFQFRTQSTEGLISGHGTASVADFSNLFDDYGRRLLHQHRLVVKIGHHFIVFNNSLLIVFTES